MISNAYLSLYTMAEHTPWSDKAIEEVTELMSVLKNLYVPASGKVTLVPKQELVYGLNILSSSYKNPSIKSVVSIVDSNQLVEKFEMYDISIYDKVQYNSSIKTLGEHLIDYIFPEDIVPICNNINKNSIVEIMEKLCKKQEEIIRERMNRLIKCAFSAATLYPPCVTLLQKYEDKKSINNPFGEFETQMEKYRKSYQDGYDNIETFNSIYSEKFDEKANFIKENIIEDMGRENGFVQLVVCGARGDKGNLQQMVSYKGRIAKSATEAFNAVITSSYLSSLTSLEQFIAAYGSRKSLIDKVRKPAETGDASRRLVHTAINAVIVSDDCYTTDGIEISADKITEYAAPKAISNEIIEEMIAYILEGRYEAGNSDKIIIREQAKSIASDLMLNRKKSIKIRSPITCKDKYCSKCYGIDLTVNKKAIKGLPIGVIAAQSIGEPGTQLSMRTFHKGGVSSKADITSDFDKIKSIINMVYVGTDNNQYDPIAWDDGETYINDLGDKYEVGICNSKQTVILKNKPYLKRTVRKGESMSLLLGNCNIKDIETCGNTQKALEYIIFSIFSIYFQQATVNLKHIEIVASEMVKYIIIGKETSAKLPIGMILNNREFVDLNDKNKYEIVPKLYNSIQAPLVGENFLSGMAFSYFKDVYSLSMLMEKTDTLKNAFSRILMGLTPLSGTSVPSYLEERKQLFQTEIEIY